MRRIHLIAVVVLILIALIFAYSQAPQRRDLPTPQATQTTDEQRLAVGKTIATQQRVNRYFHGDVVPKLKSCWINVQGKGIIALKYTYAKAGERWIFSRLETDQSTLPRGQDTVARKCMLDAVRGTSFPVEGPENTENTFVVSWNWPVPFPANSAQLTSAMFAARASQGAGGGCDGGGSAAKCFACSNLACYKVCVGYQSCTVTLDEANRPTICRASTACASGGPFGVRGGSLVIY